MTRLQGEDTPDISEWCTETIQDIVCRSPMFEGIKSALTVVLAYGGNANDYEMLHLWIFMVDPNPSSLPGNVFRFDWIAGFGKSIE